MDISINQKAYYILLKVLLSCRCPVSDNTEKKLINYYKKNSEKRHISYDTIINLADQEEDETVFHRLKEFVICSVNDLSKGYEITVEDVLRHFSSIYHWKVVINGLQNSYKKVIHIPSWFISHMLLPIDIQTNKGQYQISCTLNNLTINLNNLFIPSDLSISSNKYYCAHFASVISDISRAQYKLLQQQANEIPQFELFYKGIEIIDYLNFQRYGNYSLFCNNRYKKYFR